MEAKELIQGLEDYRQKINDAVNKEPDYHKASALSRTTDWFDKVLENIKEAEELMQ